MKRFLYLFVLTSLLAGSLPAFAFARDGEDSSEDSRDQVEESNDQDQSDDDSADSDSNDDDDSTDSDSNDDDDSADSDSDDDDDDLEHDAEEAIDDSFESDGDVDSQEGGDETVVSEEVDEDELTDEMVQDLEEVISDGHLPDAFYLSVQWGLFPLEVPSEDASGIETDWSGSVLFEDNDADVSVVARPFKTLRFEKNQDALDLENTTYSQTTFDSAIYVHNDGILFKVRADLMDEGTKVVFDSAYEGSRASVYLSDLMTDGGATFAVGEYSVVMKVFTKEDWVEKHSEHHGSGRGQHISQWVKPTDAEEGSWYEDYMNYAVDEGFFQGYKDHKGELTGQIGPGDSLTRFQLLKVITNLAESLDRGVGSLTCDEEAAVTNSETDWMGDHWARGYVQCALDSGYSVTLLDSVIDEDVSLGDQPTLRWEVLTTAAELLGLDVPVTDDTTPEDVKDSSLEDNEKDAIAYFYDLGVVGGYPDGEFKPERTVNRAEMFKIVILLLETLGL